MGSQMKKEFYFNWDHSYFEQLFQKKDSLHRLGAGRHFSAYLCRRAGFHYVLCVSHPSFFEAQRAKPQSWINCMKALKELDHPWIPPFELMECSNCFAYVRPYCETLRMDSGRGDAVCNKQFEKVLAEAGLVLDDYWHFGFWKNEHQIMIDWSDLRRR